MIIEAKERATRATYNHQPLTDAALTKPGSFFTDDADDYPNTSPGQIRRGAMKDYRPAGAWTAKRIEGRVYVAFIGVPKRPWSPDDGLAFDSLERTLNPDRCPEGTPERVLEALRALREKTVKETLDKAGVTVESKAEKKARKKKKAKKRKS